MHNSTIEAFAIQYWRLDPLCANFFRLYWLCNYSKQVSIHPSFWISALMDAKLHERLGDLNQVGDTIQYVDVLLDHLHSLVAKQFKAIA